MLEHIFITKNHWCDILFSDMTDIGIDFKYIFIRVIIKNICSGIEEVTENVALTNATVFLILC